MLNPAAVAGGRAPGAASLIPTTYSELYDLQGLPHRGNVFQRFTDDANTGADLLRFVTSIGGSYPQVFLGCVEREGRAIIVPVHRPALFAQLPTPSPHDGRSYAFLGDLLRGGHIEMAEIRSDMFDSVGAVEVRTAAETDIALQTRAEGDALLPPLEGDDDTEIVNVRRLMPVPEKYISIVLSASECNPIRLWEELVGAIQTDGETDECQPLLAWMQLAVCEQDEAGGRPAVSLGPEDTAFPPWRSKELLEFRQRLVEQDFAPWNRSETNNQDRLADFLEVMRREQDRERATRDAEARADKLPVKPSDKFPWASRRFLLLSGVEDERDLPPVYAALANATKQERRLCLQEFVEERRQDPTSAGAGRVLVTKELHDMVVSGQVGDELQLDDLTAGLQPFTCGFGTGPTTSTVQARVDAFDTSMAGNALPTMAEQLHFRTKEVVLPADPFLFQHMLNATSVCVDVVQGTTHPHAQALRNFVTRDVPRIIMDVNGLEAADRERMGNIYPRILREVQLTMCIYFGRLLRKDEPEPPTYSSVQGWVAARRFRDFPELPAKYMSSPTRPQGDGGSATREEPTESGGSGGLGQQVTNDQATRRDWQTKFADSGKTIAQLRPNAPQDGNNKDICLSYHLKGKCFSNCGRRESHRVLTGAARRNFQTFVDESFGTPTRPRPPSESSEEASSGHDGRRGQPAS